MGDRGDENVPGASSSSGARRKEAKARRKDQRSWENIMKRVADMPDAQRNEYIKEKYMSLYNDLRKKNSNYSEVERSSTNLEYQANCQAWEVERQVTVHNFAQRRFLLVENVRSRQAKLEVHRHQESNFERTVTRSNEVHKSFYGESSKISQDMKTYQEKVKAFEKFCQELHVKRPASRKFGDELSDLLNTSSEEEEDCGSDLSKLPLTLSEFLESPSVTAPQSPKSESSSDDNLSTGALSLYRPEAMIANPSKRGKTSHLKKFKRRARTNSAEAASSATNSELSD